MKKWRRKHFLRLKKIQNYMADNKTWSDSQSFQLHSTSKTRLCFAPAAEPVSARLAGVCVLSRRPAGPEPFPPGPASSVWADPAETNRLKQPGHSLVPSHWTPLGPSLSFLVAWAICKVSVWFPVWPKGDLGTPQVEVGVVTAERQKWALPSGSDKVFTCVQ